MSLSWKLCGDEIWGYADPRDPFTAYAVRERKAPSWPSHEAWSQRGETPRLLGTFPGAQAAMKACEKDHAERGLP